jgi:hypothetical protein
MKKILVAAAMLVMLSGSSFAAQSEEGMNNREAMHEMLVVLKHQMVMMEKHMAELHQMQIDLETMEAGGSVSKHK